MRELKWLILFVILLLSPAVMGQEDDEDEDTPTVDNGLKGAKVPLKTDDEVVNREEQAMASDGYSVAEQKLMRESAERHSFQAEVSRLMHIIINSLYSNREIFLRELISNASDALDKIRFLSLTDPSQLGEGEQANLEIRIKIDKDNKTLHIFDRGIGMTKEELVKNLGTIAQSGTKEFLQKFSEGDKNTSNLIGQFGVGFYSVFLVADSVVVTSKHNDDDQYVWTSSVEGGFTVTKDPQGNTLGRGTRVSLHLKDDALEFLEQDTIKTIAKKYSEFINFPIYLYSSKVVEKEVPVEEEEKKEEAPAEEEKKEEAETKDVEVEEEEEEEEAEEKPKTKKVSETVWDWELLNETKPIWTRSPKEITDEEYKNFFKSVTKESDDPMKWAHFTAEGEAEFKAILYIPSTPPYNMFDPNVAAHRGSLKLYVRRVFITDDFNELVPNYLRFIRGIVDSDDLPLNVSREMLQQHKILKQIEKKIVRKSIAMFQELSQAEDKEDYRKFWKNYGTNVKLGVIEDHTNRSRLQKLLMFQSSKTGEVTTFDDYVSRMKEGQDQIFYLAGPSKESIEKSPLIEKVIKKGYEVLYMVDPIDEYTLQHVQKYDGKYKLTNLGKEGVKLDDKDEEEEKKKVEGEFQPLADYMKDLFSEKIEKVVVSDRLTKSPCALVSTSYGYTANMERIMKAQALGQQNRSNYIPKKILEINPRHPIVQELNRRVQENKEDESAKVTAKVLYETAVLSSGYSVEDPSSFAQWIHQMMSLNLNLDPATTEVLDETTTEKTTTESTNNNNDVKDEL
jgi:heat shock protein beta